MTRALSRRTNKPSRRHSNSCKPSPPRASERMVNARTGTTGNIVAAVFRHDTSRALDPHLHTHCIVFNATFDPVEARWKALQNHDMLMAQKFIENVYYHELSRRSAPIRLRHRKSAAGGF